MFILIRLTQHFSGIIMPIVRRRDYLKNCMWRMPGCVGCSRAEFGTGAVCTQCTQLVSVLLTMGIMMPETCWVNLINIYTCGIQLVLSYPTLTMRGHTKLKLL